MATFSCQPVFVLSLVFVFGFVCYGVVGQPSFACDSRVAGMASFPFCDKRLPLRNRIQDLIGRLTLKEKVQLLASGATGVPRLGIPNYEWWSEALHGVSNTGPGTRFAGPIPAATSFPQVILSAASFNPSLWEAIGQAVSTEARAMYNAGLAGLTFWSPNVNIFRDPRWGRGQETPGEDPTVAGKYAVSYVGGLQSAQVKNPNRLKVAACCKHYTAYDLDNWMGVDRFHFNAIVTQQDLADTYNPPFKTCVTEGRVASVMCSYNKVNGVPTCADPKLLTDTVRGQWQLNGYIASDCDSVQVFYSIQHWTSTPERAVADAIGAGLDVNCGTFLRDHAEAAVRTGKLKESAIDGALFHSLKVQMRLGMFDGNPATQPFGNLGPNDVCTPQHQQLALEAAREGIVLLKNENRALPFSASRIRTLAVIGPNADATSAMIGNYAGVPCRYTSPVQGLSTYTRTVFKAGCENVRCPGTPTTLGMINDAVAAASQADATVIVVGSDLSVEAEGLDRTNINLPGMQPRLVLEATAASKGPVILVVMSGGPMDITFAKHNTKISSILWVGFPGQAGGQALADIIFGSHNPGGRLPNTWYPQAFVERVPMTNMNMRPDPATGYPGRTYRFYKGSVVFPFGFGLSYTSFSHSLHAESSLPSLMSLPLRNRNLLEKSNLTCGAGNSSICGASSVHVDHIDCQKLQSSLKVLVQNTGERAGSHVVLLFASPPESAVKGAPQKRLVAFEKIHLEPNTTQMVNFDLEVCKHLSVADEDGENKIPLGVHQLHVGDLKQTIHLQIDG
eukprot:TRINITY_DN14694_c1_g1_i1.p1 TRINITY_DN14694_c1_g1~~TRINITY_DN14694_c1_g1_i1.p1  ORF type:complete len:790 (+),score=95.89 TRINITY_DN14694_c1_g1_i1:31-2400(+)